MKVTLREERVSRNLDLVQYWSADGVTLREERVRRNLDNVDMENILEVSRSARSV